GAEKLVDHHGHGRRQPLSAKFRRHRYADPTAFHNLLVGFLKPRGRCHAAIAGALAALLISDPIERSQDFLAEFCRLTQHRFHYIRRSVGEARKISVVLNMKDVVEQKQRIIHWSLVSRHDRLPAAREVLTGYEEGPATHHYDGAGLHLY